MLGIYFKLYKQYFHEEDPEWVGYPTNQALLFITKFTSELAENDYRRVIIFIKKIIPLWVIRLKNEHDFPNRRPSIQQLFCGRRHFWTNRNLYYKQWQDR